MVLDLTLAIDVMRAYGLVKPGGVRIVIVVAVNTVTVDPPPIAGQHAGQHAGLPAGPIAIQHAGPQGAPQGAPQAAAAVTLMMVSVKDVVRQLGSGVILETTAAMPGEISKIVFSAGFALMGGIAAVVLGAPESSMMVPREV